MSETINDINEDELQIVNQSDNEVEQEHEVDDLGLCDESQVYVISVDDTPVYYVRDLNDAKDSMWNLARQLKNKCNNFKSIMICETKPNELTLVGKQKFSIVAYDRVLHRIKVSEVSELAR
jgi:hypothetical protein